MEDQRKVKYNTCIRHITIFLKISHKKFEISLAKKLLTYQFFLSVIAVR